MGGRALTRGGGSKLGKLLLEEGHDGGVVVLNLEHVLARAGVERLGQEVAVLVRVRRVLLDLVHVRLRLGHVRPHVVLALRRVKLPGVHATQQLVGDELLEVLVQKRSERFARGRELVRVQSGFVPVDGRQSVVRVPRHAKRVGDLAQVHARVEQVAVAVAVLRLLPRRGRQRRPVPDVALEPRDGLVPERALPLIGVSRRAHPEPPAVVGSEELDGRAAVLGDVDEDRAAAFVRVGHGVGSGRGGGGDGRDGRGGGLRNLGGRGRVGRRELSRARARDGGLAVLERALLHRRGLRVRLHPQPLLRHHQPVSLLDLLPPSVPEARLAARNRRHGGLGGGRSKQRDGVPGGTAGDGDDGAGGEETRRGDAHDASATRGRIGALARLEQGRGLAAHRVVAGPMKRRGFSARCYVWDREEVGAERRGDRLFPCAQRD